MASWAEFEAAAPELARRARGYLDAGVHKTIATLRRDGSPRISGIETIIADGELWLGSMWHSFKARDLIRDPRFALHSASPSPPAWTGDAKVTGHAVEVTDAQVIASVFGQLEQSPPGQSHLFRLDIREASVVRLGDPPDHLVTELWRPGEPVRRTTRT